MSHVLLLALTLGSPFSDGAVIPRDRPVPVWGVADPSARVTVSFAGQKVETTAGADGAWRIVLAPMPASQESRDLVVTEAKDKSEEAKGADAPSLTQTIKQSNIQTITLSDVLVGEVWLCAGQSNMQEPLGYGPGWNDVNGVLEAKLTDEPTVRFATIPTTAAKAPRAFTSNTNLVWTKFCGLDRLWNFSAVAYHFALNVRRGLKDVPIGILWAAYGGMPIQPFVSAEGYASVPELNEYTAKLASLVDSSDPACKDPKGWGTLAQPTVLYNSMIAPVRGIPVRGVVWYQGETNITNGDKYRLFLHGLAKGWRKAFGDEDLDFLVVRLAPHVFSNAKTDEDLPRLWAAQDRFADEDPHAVTVVIDDSGHPNDVHAPYKRNVGLRLAACALARHYGRTDIEYRSPRLKAATLADGGRVDLTFDFAPLGFYSVNAVKQKSGLRNFELAGTDGVWHEAEGRLENHMLSVVSSAVPEPRQVRYMWKKGAVGDLYCRGSNLMPRSFCADVRVVTAARNGR